MSPSATARSVRPAGRNATARRRIPRPQKTRSSSAIAQAHGVHPAEICLKWAVQRGQTPIPFSAKRRNYMANLRAVVQDPLTAAEMEAIAKLDRNCRLIKGQVFCWKENQSWEDLWDVNGVITPA